MGALGSLELPSVTSGCTQWLSETILFLPLGCCTVSISYNHLPAIMMMMQNRDRAALCDMPIPQEPMLHAVRKSEHNSGHFHI